ncbi:radical SAM protein [Butyrivibrio sp. LC3010]|uniref:radical SAM protein n=1 Tax=Butyrivibrio sp. LC3010 TaxID=1280680 RepID=UPI001FA6FFA4|nr:radical SAM protein [Butyrivibrio sp. LC3010]
MMNEMMNKCMLCPRKCGVNRLENELGYCGQGATLTAARAYLHAWEEPCISGENGSGTVFFSGCNMRCVFCQNAEIAKGDVAKAISSERLAEIFLELQEKKASNINLVTPTHFVPLIIPAIESAKRQGLIIPVLYNTSAYENVETLKMLEGLIDIYLPDCKYYYDDLAVKYSNAAGYFDISIKAIEEMLRQVGEPEFFNDGVIPRADKGAFYEEKHVLTAAEYNEYIENAEDDYLGPLMKKGVIIRHLMLPGCLEDSKKVIEELLTRFGDKVYLSVMNQFTPHGDLGRFPELMQGVKTSDYDELIDYAIDLGIENGFFQGEGTDSESFIPAFDFEGL